MSEWHEYSVQEMKLITIADVLKNFNYIFTPDDQSLIKNWILDWRLIGRPKTHFCHLAFFQKPPYRKFVMWLKYKVSLTTPWNNCVYEVQSAARITSERNQLLMSNSLLNMKKVVGHNWTIDFKVSTFVIYDDLVPIPRSRVTLHDCNLSTDIINEFNNPEFSDFRIFVDSTPIYVHKAILAARSPVFRGMFASNMIENETGRIEITDFDLEVVTLLLHFIYKGNVKIPDFDVAAALYRAANFYNIKDLTELCQTYLASKIDVTNVADVLLLSDINVGPELKAFAMEYFLKNSKGFDMSKFEEIEDRSPNLLSELIVLFSKKCVENRVILNELYHFKDNVIVEESA